jgi:epoxyqueuosine reductase
MSVAGGWNPELESIVRAAAMEAGFHLAGVASAHDDSEASALDADRFAAWVDAGRAGEMEYLKRRDATGRLLRSSVRVAIPWAKSVVVCAVNYDSELPRSIDPAASDAGWIGRYAWSGRVREQGSGNGEQAGELAATDYHEELLGRLRMVEARLRDQAECETRCYVDTGPIVERGFAAMAGVGWTGKNTCVINQELGSWLLLGVIVTSLPMEVETAARLAPDRCGNCTRCIDACPTGALVAPREMDASLCIAYLTIEKKGTIAENLREGMGRQVFGCDICQDVCPWNRRGGNRRLESSVTPGMEPRKELVNPSLDWLAGMGAKEFKRWFKRSPLERTGRKRLHRNVAIAMGNSGEIEFLPRLREWAEGDDEVLAEAARWALERIRTAMAASIGSGS